MKRPTDKSILTRILLRVAVCVFSILYSALFPAASHAIGIKTLQTFRGSSLEMVKPWQVASLDGGWTFIATDDGLIQYDGADMRTFLLNNRYSLRSVNADPNKNRIYVGGISEFGYFKPSPGKSLEYVCISDSVGEDRHVGNIWGVYSHNNQMIVQGDRFVLVYDEIDGTHWMRDSKSKLDCSAMVGDVLWLGTDDGLKILMGKMIVDAPGADLLKGKRIRAMLPWGNGILVVTNFNGVYSYDNNRLTRLEAPSQAAESLGDVFSADIHGNTLALGSIDNGVGVVDMTSGAMQIYNEESGLPNNTVLTVAFDKTGDLWAGLDPGVAKIMLTLPIETLSNNPLPIGSGYQIAIHDNRMYLGTNRGLYSSDFMPGADMSRSSFRKLETISGQVWGLTPSPDGLFCCTDRGLYLVNGGHVEQIPGVDSAWDLQFWQENPSRAYVGTYSGLKVLRKSNGKWVTEGSVADYDGSCFNFVQDSASRIFSDDGENGIYRINIDTAEMRVTKMINYKETADGESLLADIYLSRIDNNTIICTSKGVYAYDRKKEAIVPDEKLSVLLGSPGVTQKVRKLNGWLYTVTDKEIIQSDPAGILGLKRLPLPVSDRKPISENNVLFSVAPDYLVYPTRSGYLFYDFSDRNADDTSPKLPSSRINSVTVTSRGDSVVFLSNFLGLKDKFTLRHSENSVRIYFGSFGDAISGVRYSTRINGGKWSEPTSSILKEFTDLREGEYLFEVKAFGPDGMESSDSIAFEVLPPWWRSIWAKCVYVILALVAIWVIVMIERRRVRRKEESLVAEKDAEMARQQADFEWESKMKDHKIVELEKEQLDRELRHKAQEMANVMMSLTHKNETLQTVKRELQNIHSLLPKSMADARGAIQELQGKVTVDIKSDDVLKRLEEEFDIVHNDFIKRLRERHPDLSNNEVLMCAYIKMNLSTKEIAPLLNISVRGVETMRYRIRKKFGLEREDNLNDYLNKTGQN